MGKDVNWIGFSGPQDNGRVINSSHWNAPKNPQEYSDLFKCSHVDDLTARGLIIPIGSMEDSIDAVRGNNYHWIDCIVSGSTTIKGSISGWTFSHCDIGRTVEIGQFDNYWKIGRAPTRNGLIEHCLSMGENPILVKIWDGEAPRVIMSNVKIIKIPKIIWFPYFCFRYVTYRLFERP